MTFIILALSVGVLVLGVRWFLRRAPHRGKRFLLQLLLVSFALLTLWLALTGRLHWLVALFGSLLPFARRLLPLLIPLLRGLPQFKRQRRSRQQKSGQQSNVQTQWLAMTLDHDSGEISGQITAGPMAGQSLQSLSDSQLIELYQQCISKDPQALKLLDNYITRHRPSMTPQTEGDQPQDNPGNNRQQSNRHASDNDGDISVNEAFQVLGLEPGASEAEIIKAHKRMMQKLHPDRGGSNYLAAKINQAKQRLLR